MKRLWLILYLLPLLAQNSSSPSKVIQQNKEVTLIQEAGYILAMQTVFIGKKKLKIALVAGPERITPEWWQSANFHKETRYMSSNTRDYYRVEDLSGKRYWIYKEGIYQHDKTSKWYIHGFFP